MVEWLRSGWGRSRMRTHHVSIRLRAKLPNLVVQVPLSLQGQTRWVYDLHIRSTQYTLHTHTHAFIHIHTHTHLRTRTNTHTCVHAHTHTRICTHTYLRAPTHTHTPRTHIHTRTHTHSYTHTHTRICTLTHTRTHTYSYTHTHTHTHTHSYTHAFTHTHSYTCTHKDSYTYTHTLAYTPHTRTHTHTYSYTTHTHTLAYTYTHAFVYPHLHTHAFVQEEAYLLLTTTGTWSKYLLLTAFVYLRFAESLPQDCVMPDAIATFLHLIQPAISSNPQPIVTSIIFWNYILIIIFLLAYLGSCDSHHEDWMVHILLLFQCISLSTSSSAYHAIFRPAYLLVQVVVLTMSAYHAIFRPACPSHRIYHLE